ncbi:Chromosome partitioning protein ParA [bacterium HR11]|nr:Chromosome partitioning protein ParA [bacterium HR11]
MRVLAIANHKGGVGKTATAHALGTSVHARGLRVLLVDMDPQGSLTGSCGIRDAAGRSMAEVLGGATPGSLSLRDILRFLRPGLALAPSDLALAATELGLVSRLGRESVLRKSLRTVETDFDLTIVDCPPSLGLLTVNALTAADAVLVPTQPQAVDLRGLRLFLDTLERIREELNPNLEVLGVLPTFVDLRLVHHREALEVLRAAGLPVLEVLVGRSVRVAEAASVGESIVTYAPDHPQSQVFQQLGEIVIRWATGRPDDGTP